MTRKKNRKRVSDQDEDIEGYFAECCKTHDHIGGKIDGCQEFDAKQREPMTCRICNCDQGFHRRVVPKYKTEVVYTKCHKIHDFKVPNSVDGCQEFTIRRGVADDAADFCESCGCHKSFHRNEITKEILHSNPIVW